MLWNNFDILPIGFVFVFVFTSIQMCNIIVNLFCVWLLLSACTYESENKISLEIESMCAWANIGRKEKFAAVPFVGLTVQLFKRTIAVKIIRK